MESSTKDDGKKRVCVLPPIRLSETEKSRIKRRAEKAGMSLSNFIREVALNGKIIIKKENVDYPTINELRRIGNNLNQQTKHMNAGRRPKGLEVVWKKLEQTLDLIVQKKEQE